MKYIHFVQFATAMLNEHINCLHDNTYDTAQERAIDRDFAFNITSAMAYVAARQDEEDVIDETALDLGMYEFIEGFADDEEHYLYDIAQQYVIPC